MIGEADSSNDILGGIIMAGGSDLRRSCKAILCGALVWCAVAGTLVFQLWAALPLENQYRSIDAFPDAAT